MRLLAFVLSSLLLAPVALAQGEEEPVNAKPSPAAKGAKPAPAKAKAKAKRKTPRKGATALPGRTGTDPKGLNPSRTYKPKPSAKEEEEEAAQPVKAPEKAKDRGARGADKAADLPINGKPGAAPR